VTGAAWAAALTALFALGFVEYRAEAVRE
jgi:hypothetical protein